MPQIPKYWIYFQVHEIPILLLQIFGGRRCLVFTIPVKDWKKFTSEFKAKIIIFPHLGPGICMFVKIPKKGVLLVPRVQETWLYRNDCLWIVLISLYRGNWSTTKSFKSQFKVHDPVPPPYKVYSLPENLDLFKLLKTAQFLF